MSTGVIYSPCPCALQIPAASEPATSDLPRVFGCKTSDCDQLIVYEEEVMFVFYTCPIIGICALNIRLSFPLRSRVHESESSGIDLSQNTIGQMFRDTVLQVIGGRTNHIVSGHCSSRALLNSLTSSADRPHRSAKACSPPSLAIFCDK